MDNLSYLFAAYTVIWVAVFGYIFLLHQKHRRLQRQIELLEAEKSKRKTN